MASKDAIKERIGWLKVLFGVTAAVLASLLGWLLADLSEHPDLLGEFLFLDVLSWVNFVVFLAIAASPLTMFHLTRRGSTFRKVAFVVVVAVVDVAMLIYLIGDLYAKKPKLEHMDMLNSWHEGAIVTIAILSLALLASIWEVNKLIERLEAPIRDQGTR